MRWFFTGLLVTLVITDIGKLVVGRLRPHFLDVCNPNFSSINCTDEHDYTVYVTEYECRGDPSLVAAARYPPTSYVVYPLVPEVDNSL